MTAISLRRLRIALAMHCSQHQMRQAQIAERMMVQPATLSDWLLGIQPAPLDLLERLGAAIGIPAESLRIIAEQKDASLSSGGGQ